MQLYHDTDIDLTNLFHAHLNSTQDTLGHYNSRAGKPLRQWTLNTYCLFLSYVSVYVCGVHVCFILWGALLILPSADDKQLPHLPRYYVGSGHLNHSPAWKMPQSLRHLLSTTLVPNIIYLIIHLYTFIIIFHLLFYK